MRSYWIKLIGWETFFMERGKIVDLKLFLTIFLCFLIFFKTKIWSIAHGVLSVLLGERFCSKKLGHYCCWGWEINKFNLDNFRRRKKDYFWYTTFLRWEAIILHNLFLFFHPCNFWTYTPSSISCWCFFQCIGEPFQSIKYGEVSLNIAGADKDILILKSSSQTKVIVIKAN